MVLERVCERVQGNERHCGGDSVRMDVREVASNGVTEGVTKGAVEDFRDGGIKVKV